MSESFVIKHKKNESFIFNETLIDESVINQANILRQTCNFIALIFS